MNSPSQNGMPGDAGRSGEDTLRLIAGIPAPEGLTDRVRTRLRTAPRTAGLIPWPIAGTMAFRIHSPAFRTAAAAAIVGIVGGGGWQIFSHVQNAPSANAVVQPARIGNSGGFSNAGAMRTPDTLDRPVLKDPAIPAQQDAIAPGSSPKPERLTPQAKAARHRNKVRGSSVP
jgi:hypothetical protein